MTFIHSPESASTDSGKDAKFEKSQKGQGEIPGTYGSTVKRDVLKETYGVRIATLQDERANSSSKYTT